jgi:hypothetical protein
MVSFSCEVRTPLRALAPLANNSQPERTQLTREMQTELRRRLDKEEAGPPSQSVSRCALHLPRLHGPFSGYRLPRSYGMLETLFETLDPDHSPYQQFATPFLQSVAREYNLAIASIVLLFSPSIVKLVSIASRVDSPLYSGVALCLCVLTAYLPLIIPIVHLLHLGVHSTHALRMKSSRESRLHGNTNVSSNSTELH